MNFFIAQGAKKPAAKDSYVFDEEKSLESKARFSLVIVWVSAVLICLVFILFIFIPLPVSYFFKNNAVLITMQQDGLLNNTLQINGNNREVLLPNNREAFVFVNIDKQFFLTRFPPGRQDEEVVVTGAGKNVKAGGPDLKQTGSVIRKARSITKYRSGIDFSVKPVPQ